MLNKVNDKLINLKYDVKEKMFNTKLDYIALDTKGKVKKVATDVVAPVVVARCLGKKMGIKF